MESLDKSLMKQLHKGNPTAFVLSPEAIEDMKNDSDYDYDKDEDKDDIIITNDNEKKLNTVPVSPISTSHSMKTVMKKRKSSTIRMRKSSSSSSSSSIVSSAKPKATRKSSQNQ